MPLRRENTFIVSPRATQVRSGAVCGVESPRSLVQDTHTQGHTHMDMGAERHQHGEGKARKTGILTEC